MNTNNFTAFEEDELVTKPINETLFNEVTKVHALFGDVDFHWGPLDGFSVTYDDILSAWVNDVKGVKIIIFSDGNSPYIG